MYFLKSKIKSISGIIQIGALLYASISSMAQSSCTETGQGAFHTGVYRNIFKELLNKTDVEVNSKINTAFQQIFYGTSNKKLYYEVRTDMAYILDVANNDVRSEGMSYGLMICAQLDKKQNSTKYGSR